MTAAHPHHRALQGIGIYKLAKGLLLMAVAAGLFALIGRDVDATVRDVIRTLHADPESRYLHRLLALIVQVDDHRLKAIGVGTLCYAALSIVEGVGLILEKRWGEYFTVIATSAFIPIEIYEVLHRFTVMRVAVLAFNVTVVAYVISLLRRERPG